MPEVTNFLLTLGGIFLLALATDALGRRTFLPRVTLLLVLGAVAGKEALNLVPPLFFDRFDIISDMALLMIGFLLGGRLTSDLLKQSINKVMWISLCAALGTTAIVTTGLVLIGVSHELAILLGCIASATAPAASVDIVIESNYKGPFSNLLLSIVALDDAWGLILFSVGIAVVSTMNGMTTDVSPLMLIAKEIGGAIMLGLFIGLPAAYLTGRIKPGQPMLTEALGLVFLCGGLALWFDVSFLIASIVMGAVIANFALHHEQPFHAIEEIEWPFMVLFFFIAGASLELSVVKQLGQIGIVYVFCRILGKIAGARIGSHIGAADRMTKRWMGIALLPQAGVAIGMGLVASHRFPGYSHTLLPIIIGSTIFFEIVGPIFTRMALQKGQRA